MKVCVRGIFAIMGICVSCIFVYRGRVSTVGEGRRKEGVWTGMNMIELTGGCCAELRDARTAVSWACFRRCPT